VVKINKHYSDSLYGKNGRLSKNKTDTKKLEDFMARTKIYDEKNKPIPEGVKVKLDIDEIMAQPDYLNLTEKYRTWVESHQNDVFTVEYEEKYGRVPKLVVLKEDTTKPQWIFWVGDLIKQ